MRLVQVVPELPPDVGGVGDYASLLAQQLQRRGIETIFALSDRTCPPARVLGCEGLAKVSLFRPRANALAQLLDAARPDAVLVHYSGYGYARRGAPVWLARGLRRWKTGAAGSRLVIMFHEVWAFGPPWRSSFWMFPLQGAVAGGLLGLADAFLTNTGLHATRLRRLAPHRSPEAVLPVLSNIGEPERPPPLNARESLAVVFGRPEARRRVYAHLEDFLPFLDSAGVEGILDVGPPVAEPATARSPLPVTRCGYLDAASASAVMLRARFGLLDYPLNRGAKSGILAAYTAHGVLPLIRSAVDGAPDGLQPGVNLLRTGGAMPALSDAAQQLATAAYLWYREHALERAGACFGRAIQPARGAAEPSG